MGIVPAVGLAQGTAPAAAVPAGTVRVEVSGIVPARGIDRAGAVLSAPGTGRAEAVPSAPGTVRTGAAEVPAGTVPARGTVRAEAVLSAPGTGLARGTGPVAGTGRPWAERGTAPVGIGRLGAGPSCACS